MRQALLVGLLWASPLFGQVGDGSVRFPLGTRRAFTVYTDLGISPSIEGEREYSLGLRASWSCDRVIAWAGAQPVHFGGDARGRVGWLAGALFKMLPGVNRAETSRGAVTLDPFLHVASTTEMETGSVGTGVGVGVGALVTAALPLGFIPLPPFRNADYDLVMAPRWDDVFDTGGFAFTIGLHVSRPDPPVKNFALMWHADRRQSRVSATERWSTSVTLARRWIRPTPTTHDPGGNQGERCFAF